MLSWMLQQHLCILVAITLAPNAAEAATGGASSSIDSVAADASTVAATTAAPSLPNAAPKNNQSVRFRQESLCPSTSTAASSSGLLKGVQSQQSCSVECALRSDCAVYGFNSSIGECRMASTEELLTSWQTPSSPRECIAQLNFRLPGVLSFRSSLLAYLDFRIGQSNLVSSTRFGVKGTSAGIRFDSGGAVFPPIPGGGESNFIELATTAVGGALAFGDLLGRGRNFSVYARVQRLSNQQLIFYSMTSCSNYNVVRGAFSLWGGRLIMIHALADPTEMRFRTGSATLSETSGQYVGSSTGAVFDGAMFTAAYSNGMLFDVQDFTGITAPSFTGKPECIRLGFNQDATLSLVGRYVCFALIGKTLSAQEFAELDQLCA